MSIQAPAPLNQGAQAPAAPAPVAPVAPQAPAPAAPVAPQAPAQAAPKEPQYTGLPPVSQEQQASLDNYITAAGIQPSHVEAELDANGALSDLTKQLNRNKHGEHAELILDNIEATYQQTLMHEQQKEKETHGEVATLLGIPPEQGGQAMSQIISWAVTKFSDEEIDGIANMVESGGMQGKIALKHLVEQWQASNSVQPNLVGGSQVPVTGGGMLDRDTYNKERFKVQQEHGYNSPQMEQLQARRLAAIQQGY